LNEPALLALLEEGCASQHVNVDVPAKPKFDSSIPQILAYGIDGFRCSQPATVLTKYSLPPLDLIPL
jgi:hypothetical protein